MYELIKASDSAYYIDCPTKIGIIKVGESEVFLIDSGNHRETGKKVLKILNNEGWTLKAIINTHSHADHIGGNRFLQASTGCKIYAKGIDKDFTNHPTLMAALAWGGKPLPELRHKFLLAEESVCEELSADIFPDGFEIIDLSGHTPDMIGIKTPDGVVFLADCLSSEAILDKYKISFIYDIKAYLETLEKVKNIDGVLFVPSHAASCEDITPLAQYNIDKVNEVREKILKFLETPLSFEELLKKLFDEYELTLTHEQYALVGSTVRSYFACLEDEKLIEGIIEENKLIWRRK
jgi:glyoxylase-like metal-dependent hydrolase (beta-lactamase superfamily II)